MKLDKTFNFVAKPLQLNGYRALVVGGTGGIGRSISHRLANAGASVTVVGRTFRDDNVKGIDFIKADLSSMREASRLADNLKPNLDLIIFTNGIISTPERQTTQEGIERDLATSYLSRRVILQKLGPRLKDTRVFIMAYPGTGEKGNAADLNSERSYKQWPAHMNTVAGNEILVLDGVTSYPNAKFYGLNPGWVSGTAIRDNFFKKGSWIQPVLDFALSPVMITPDAYADRIMPLLVAPELENHNGSMFDNKARAIFPTDFGEAHKKAFLAASDDLLKSHPL